MEDGEGGGDTEKERGELALQELPSVHEERRPGSDVVWTGMNV